MARDCRTLETINIALHKRIAELEATEARLHNRLDTPPFRYVSGHVAYGWYKFRTETGRVEWEPVGAVEAQAGRDAAGGK